MLGGLIATALSSGLDMVEGNGLIAGALCTKITITAKLIVDATDMNYHTGERYKATWCYGDLKNADGEIINLNHYICNRTFNDIKPGEYTIDIISAENVKLDFQTHYEFEIKAGETKTINLDNERYLVRYEYELEAGSRKVSAQGWLNTPEEYTIGSNSLTYEEGVCVSKFANYKLFADNQLVAETKNCIYDSLYNNNKIGNYSCEEIYTINVPRKTGFKSYRSSAILKSFDLNTITFTYEFEIETPYPYDSYDSKTYSLSLAQVVRSSPNTFCSTIKQCVPNNLMPTYQIFYDAEELRTEQIFPVDGFNPVNLELVWVYKNNYKHENLVSQTDVENIKNNILNVQEVTFGEEYKGELIKSNEQLCNAIAGLNPQYKWNVGSFAQLQYEEPYKWIYTTYTGFKYKA